MNSLFLRSSLVLALFGVATSQFFHRQLDDSRRVGEEALAFAQEIGFEVGIAQAQSILAMNEMCRGDLDAALVLFDDLPPARALHSYGVWPSRSLRSSWVPSAT